MQGHSPFISVLVVASPFSSFLPQDKVAEFATMSPQELLRQTQKAAGPAKMTEWHENLIRLGKECKTLYHVRLVLSGQSGHAEHLC